MLPTALAWTSGASKLKAHKIDEPYLQNLQQGWKYIMR